MSFSNRVVIVTGASSGIGAATAVLYCQEGANVVMVGRNETKLKRVAEHCKEIGKTQQTPLVVKADVSLDDDARRIIDETIDTFGRIDVLVNNAGIARLGTIEDGKVLETYDEVMGTNLRAVIHLTALATPYLKETKGNIVNVSSIAGQSTPALPHLIAYGVSKAGLNHFSRCAALELSSSGVRVNVVSPGPVNTDIAENSGIQISPDHHAIQTPLRRISESKEIADMILYLSSDKAKGITGSIWVSDNGLLLKNN